MRLPSNQIDTESYGTSFYRGPTFHVLNVNLSCRCLMFNGNNLHSHGMEAEIEKKNETKIKWQDPNWQKSIIQMLDPFDLAQHSLKRAEWF